MRPIILATCLALVSTAAQAAPPLTSPPPLAEYFAAMPRLTATTAAAQKINAQLADLDKAALKDLAEEDCGAEQSVTVTSDSTAFLSLLIQYSAMCQGAAHPYSAQTPLTFDLVSGEKVDWQSLLPKSLLDPQAEDYDPNYPNRSEALAKAYLTALPDPQPDCDVSYENPMDFDFWLDSEHHALALAPNNFPYADTVCAETAYLPAKALPPDTPQRLRDALAE